MTETPSGVELRDLSIRIGGRDLLSDTSAEFPAGDVTLVIGASGAGKSVLLKTLAGLIRAGEGGFSVTGSIRLGDRELLGCPASRRGVGIVFQSFALFDELSAEANVRFALDHRHADAKGAPRPPRELLDELRVPRNVPVRALSGGQQQRLAIARALAHDAPVLVFDEPTSGLDPENASRVAERIRETCRRHGKTAIVVTHDYAHLARVADRVYLLDTEQRRLRGLPVEQLDALERHMPGAGAFEGDVPSPPRPLRSRAAAAVVESLVASGAAVERALTTLVGLLPLWRSPRWGLRYLAHYLRLVLSPSSWLYFAAAGAIAGFVATYFSWEFLPHKRFTEPLLGDEVLQALGFALYRIIVPVLVTVLLAARCGAAMAADIGNRAWSQQVDALRTLGAPPERYLLTGILHALLIGAPLLVGVAYFAAEWTSLAVFLTREPERATFWARHFRRELELPGELLLDGTGWVLAKVLLCAVGTGAIAFYRGLGPKRSAVDVASAITATVTLASLWTLLVHFVLAFLEFPPPSS